MKENKILIDYHKSKNIGRFLQSYAFLVLLNNNEYQVLQRCFRMLFKYYKTKKIAFSFRFYDLSLLIINKSFFVCKELFLRKLFAIICCIDFSLAKYAC